MRLYFATTFPEFFDAAFAVSILGRAKSAGLVEVNPVSLRKYTKDRHQTTDDSPYGGGAGMVMKVEPFQEMLESLDLPEGTRTVLTTPAGKTFNQSIAKSLSEAPAIFFLCGHYEGVDERIANACTDWLSLGDFVMTGGEVAALAMADAIVRLVPGVLGKNESLETESFTDSLLEYPQFTRPQNHKFGDVPQVLTTGNHSKIERWRREQQLKRTLLLRPDLLALAQLSQEDKEILKSFFDEIRKTMGNL